MIFPFPPLVFILSELRVDWLSIIVLRSFVKHHIRLRVFLHSLMWGLVIPIHDSSVSHSRCDIILVIWGFITILPHNSSSFESFQVHIPHVLRFSKVAIRVNFWLAIITEGCIGILDFNDTCSLSYLLWWGMISNDTVLLMYSLRLLPDLTHSLILMNLLPHIFNLTLPSLTRAVRVEVYVTPIAYSFFYLWLRIGVELRWMMPWMKVLLWSWVFEQFASLCLINFVSRIINPVASNHLIIALFILNQSILREKSGFRPICLIGCLAFIPLMFLLLLCSNLGFYWLIMLDRLLLLIRVRFYYIFFGVIIWGGLLMTFWEQFVLQ
jgi:hypothetical protein